MTSTLLKSLSERLAYTRLSAGLTQKEAAAHLGMTQSAISEIERGKNETTISNLFKLADLYRADPRWIATGESDPKFVPPNCDHVTHNLDDTKAAFEDLSRQYQQLQASINDQMTTFARSMKKMRRTLDR